MASSREKQTVPKSFREWLSEGEQLYTSAMDEVRAIEAQLEKLDQHLAQKRAEANEIARVVGKPPAEASRRLTAQLVEAGQGPVRAPGSPNIPPPSVARALSGRSGPM
jgi:hypothetical protein